MASALSPTSSSPLAPDSIWVKHKPALIIVAIVAIAAAIFATYALTASVPFTIVAGVSVTAICFVALAILSRGGSSATGSATEARKPNPNIKPAKKWAPVTGTATVADRPPVTKASNAPKSTPNACGIPADSGIPVPPPAPPPPAMPAAAPARPNLSDALKGLGSQAKRLRKTVTDDKSSALRVYAEKNPEPAKASSGSSSKPSAGKPSGGVAGFDPAAIKNQLKKTQPLAKKI